MDRDEPPESGPVVRHIEVPRTARYAVAGSAEPLRDLWIVLHGYRQLAPRFLTRFEHLAGSGRWIVAPEALNRFYLDDTGGRHGPGSPVGATWMTREDREAEIRDYVRYLDLLVDSVIAAQERPARLGVLGFSQGVHTAARWVVEGRARPARLVLWGAYLPADLDHARAADRLASTDLVLVHGRDDPHRRDELQAEQDARLDRWHVTPRRIEHEGGHALDRDLLSELLSF